MNRNHRMLRGAALILVAALASVCVASAAGELKWETRLDRATAAALPANQPLLLDFWSATCLPCAEMDRQVFVDSRLVAAMAKVRPVRIDIDRDPAVARRYDIAGTPTLLLTDSFGRELFRYTGALSVDRMLELLDALPAQVEVFNRLSRTLSRNKDDAAALSAMARELRTAGFYRTSSDYYERALRTPDGRRAGAPRVELLVGLGRNALELQRFVDAEQFCRDALRELGGRPEAADVQVDLGRALLGQQKAAEARRVLRAVVDGSPNTAAAAAAARLLSGG